MRAKPYYHHHSITKENTFSSKVHSATKENTFSAKAAEEYERYLFRARIEHALRLLLQRLVRCAGLVAAPCLLYAFVNLMGQYHHSKPQIRRSLTNMPETISQAQAECRHNAIAHLVRKDASGGYGELTKSLDLLYQHYLNQHHTDSHVFLFHLGDFTVQDLQQLEWRYDDALRGTIQLVNIANTEYWQLPANLAKDDPSKWKGKSSMDKRHEQRFWSVHIWHYFEQVNRRDGCNYRHVLKLNPSSFIYSPIDYNIFELAQVNNYYYSFRLCEYTMAKADSVWDDFLRDFAAIPKHDWSAEDCAFSESLWLADLQFFLSRKVQRLLHFVDQGGYLYRDEFQATLLHSMAVYAYAPPETIHRFVDFTYEHFTKDLETKCPIWGAIQAGLQDEKAQQHVDEWFHVHQQKNAKCGDSTKTTQRYTLTQAELSTAYLHLPPKTTTLKLDTITMGQVETPNQAVGVMAQI
jgi:hypothetical protein